MDINSLVLSQVWLWGELLDRDDTLELPPGAGTTSAC